MPGSGGKSAATGGVQTSWNAEGPTSTDGLSTSQQVSRYNGQFKCAKQTQKLNATVIMSMQRCRFLDYGIIIRIERDLLRATWAAMTLWRSTTRRQLVQVHSFHRQSFLCPLRQETTPWLRHRAHLGVLSRRRPDADDAGAGFFAPPPPPLISIPRILDRFTLPANSSNCWISTRWLRLKMGGIPKWRIQGKRRFLEMEIFGLTVTEEDTNQLDAVRMPLALF